MTTGAQGPGASGIDAVNGEQAEVALTSGLWNAAPTLVAVFNDFSLDEYFAYSPSPADPQARRVLRGVSIMGWSYSLNLGLTWTYQGKLRPPNGWSALWGDPSLATDPNNRSVVYYAQMAVSDSAWDIATGGAAWTTLSPGRDMVDSFCVFRSTNGGVDFPEMSCMRVGTSPSSVDRTAVTVDGLGRVYVAMNRTNGVTQTGTVVFRSDIASWAAFAPLPVVARQSLSEPWLTTDPDGDVWFGSRDNRGGAGGDVSVMRFTRSGTDWDHVMSIASNCFVALGRRDPIYAIGSGRTLRNAHTFSFAVGLEEQRPPVDGTPPTRRKVLRAALQLERNDGSNFLLFRQFVVGSTVCYTGFGNGAGWSTFADPGSQFAPTLSYAEFFAGFPGWFATYLTTEGVTDSTDAYVRAKGVGVAAVQTFGGFVGVLSRQTDLTPPSWFACTRREPSTADYWGDYIGLTQAIDSSNRPWAIAAFSDSGPAPSCQAQTPFLGRPTHVASQRW